MSIIDEKDHFVSLDDMPTFNTSATVDEVYQKLAKAERGGFILNDNSNQYYINAKDLTETIMITTQPSPQKIRTELNNTIGKLCNSINIKTAIFPVEENPINVDEDTTPIKVLKEHKIFYVTNPRGIIGYFLNHEFISKPATKRLKYICKNNHKNTDPDHGTCYQCPAAIVKVEIEE